MADSNRFHPRMVQCVETGQIYKSIYQAAKSIGANTSSVLIRCEGKTEKPLKGYHFKYYSPDVLSIDNETAEMENDR